MRKGITPIISTVILLFIVISISGGAYFYIQGIFTGVTEKAFDIKPGSAYCQNGVITVYVTNNGQGDLSGDDFIAHEIDGNPVNLQIGEGDQNPDYYFTAILTSNQSVSISSGILEVLP